MLFNTAILLLLISKSALADSWQSALESKEAQLDVYWHASRPFIQSDNHGALSGVEYDLLQTFSEYILAKHQVKLDVNWIEAGSFHGIMDKLKNDSAMNLMGASAFSITEERQEYFSFSDPYLPDITVLVSSQGTPIVQGFNEIRNLMEGMRAIAIKGTVYETRLKKLKEQINLDFEIEYIDSNDNVLRKISEADKMFGFVDLPVYLHWIKEGRNLVRQNLFTIRGIGYGLVMPKNSDWNIPFNEFLADEKYKPQVDKIITKHLGIEIHRFMIEVSDREQLGTHILTKEKEIQLALIKNANLKLEKEKGYKRMLIFSFCCVLIILIITVYFFRKNQNITHLILEQKNQIQAQQQDIQLKNEQLLNRNAQLLKLNEEKNNLVSILAHDLRAPLGHISGLSGLLEASQEELSGQNKEYLKKISEAASRMNLMIEKILDVDALDRKQDTVIKEHVNVNQLMKDLAIRYQPLATNKNIELEVQFPDESLSLETDHMLLFLVLENLLSNAVKFSNPDSKILLEATDDNDVFIFKITDHGPGFTDEDKKNLFTRFKKLSAQPTGGEPSTGLGLSIVKKYVTDLGGSVELASTSQAGSVFVISLPYATESAS